MIAHFYCAEVASYCITNRGKSFQVYASDLTQMYTDIQNTTEVLSTPYYYTIDSQPSSLTIEHIVSCLTIIHLPSTYYIIPIIKNNTEIQHQLCMH